MRMLAAAVLILAVPGCFKASKPPPPPQSLNDALAAVDESVQGSGSIAQACETLATELTQYRGQGGMHVQTQADLHRLTMEVAAFGATHDDPMDQNRGEAGWAEIKKKLTRVIGGENPTEGPRYKIEMPEDVAVAALAVDSALAEGDADAARAAVGRLRGPLGEWAEKMPGPRGARLMQIASDELDMFTSGFELPAEKLKPAWERIKRRMQPGGGEED